MLKHIDHTCLSEIYKKTVKIPIFKQKSIIRLESFSNFRGELNWIIYFYFENYTSKSMIYTYVLKSHRKLVALGLFTIYWESLATIPVTFLLTMSYGRLALKTSYSL